MPYKVYKKGSGYKTCKKGGKKCFSKKPMPKEKAEAQMKALYASEAANESVVTENEVEQDSLVYKTLFKVPKLNQFHVHFVLESGRNVIFNLIYSTGETMEEVDYIETQVTDGDIPSIEFFEDPQSEEAKVILSRYGLTGDDVENAGQEGYEKVSQHMPKNEEESVKESLEFEAYFVQLFEKES